MTTESVNLKIVYDELLVLRWQNGEAAAMNELVDRWPDCFGMSDGSPIQPTTQRMSCKKHGWQ